MFSSNLLLLDVSLLVEAYQGQAVQDLLHPRLKSSKKNLKIKWPGTSFAIAWENSRHLGMLPLVSPPNDVWETSTEIPYWWCFTTQIWVVLLISWIKIPTWHDQSEALTHAKSQRCTSQPWSIFITLNRKKGQKNHWNPGRVL